MSRMRKFRLPTDDQPLVPEVDRKKLDEFANGARERIGQEPKPRPTTPWSQFDSDAKPTNGVNLRLNDYQLTLLRYVAKHEDRSQQQILRRHLIPLLEKMAQEIYEKKLL